MPRILSWAMVVFGLALPAFAAEPSKSTAKVGTTAVPKELKESIRQLLSDQPVQVVDEKGKPLCEIWFRKEIPSKAKPDEVKKGPSYKHIEPSAILGAVRFYQDWTDFRKQKIKPGVYTLRFALQPQDGNHQGTAPYNEFCLLVPAAVDTKPDPIEFKMLNEMSSKATPDESHASVVLLFPNEKPGDKPALVSKPEEIWALHWKVDLTAGGQKATLGLGVVLFGATKE
jgi:hypothetical protein